MDNRIEIPLSKVKLLLLLLASSGFVVLGVFFTFSPAKFQSSLFQKPSIIQVIGLVSLLFFALCLVVIVKKFFDKKVGLAIDDKGIADNTNGLSVGLIPWEDILGIRVIHVFTQKIIMIDVKNPEDYINKAKNGLARRSMKANWKMYGSPLSIISNSLKINFDQLLKLLHLELEKRVDLDR